MSASMVIAARRGRDRLRLRVAALAGLTLAAIVFLVGVAARPALAHATLAATSPAAGYSVTDPPVELSLDFNEAVSIQVQAVALSGPSGAVRLSDLRLTQHGRRLQATIGQRLVDGQYQVRWQVISDDGDVVAGTYYFGVGGAAALGHAGAVSGNSSPGAATTSVLRWMLFTGLALAVGGLAGERLAARAAAHDGQNATADNSPAPPPLLLPAAIVGMIATLGLAVELRGSGSLLNGLTSRQADFPIGSNPGRVALAEFAGFAVTAVLAVVARRRPTMRRWAWAPLLLVVFAEGFRGHPQTASPGVGALITATHLAAAGIWVGALVHVLRVVYAWRAERQRVRRMVAGYARLAWVLVLIVTVSGVLAALLVIPAPSALYRTGYGQTLLIKLGLVTVVLALATVGRWNLRRARGHTPGRVARWEAGTLACVLAITAVLVSLPPPADSRAVAPPPAPSGPIEPIGLLLGQINVGLLASDGRLQLALSAPGTMSDTDDNTGTPTPRFHVTAALVGSGAKARIDLRPCGPGCFTAPIRWARGQNKIHLDARATGWRGSGADVTLAWPPLPDTALLQQTIAATRALPKLVVHESVTSDTSQPAPRPRAITISGQAFLASESYGSGPTPPTVVIGNQGALTEIAFAYPASGVFYQLWVGTNHLIARETETTPGHAISRTFDYP